LCLLKFVKIGSKASLLLSNLKQKVNRHKQKHIGDWQTTGKMKKKHRQEGRE
jgi:hypothetical protein